MWVRVKCRSGECKWVIYARKLRADGSVQIRTFLDARVQIRSSEDNHICDLTYGNSLVHSRWIAKKYCEEFKCNPELDLEHFRKIVMKENRHSLTKNQIFTAKRKAMNIVHGSQTD